MPTITHAKTAYERYRWFLILMGLWPEHPTDANDSRPPHDYAPMDMKHAVEQRRREGEAVGVCPVCGWLPQIPGPTGVQIGGHEYWCTPQMREDHEIAERARYQLNISSAERGFRQSAVSIHGVVRYIVNGEEEK